MMKRPGPGLGIALLAMAAVSAPPATYAAPLSAQQLYAICSATDANSKSRATNRGLCQGYIVGVANAFVTLEPFARKGSDDPNSPLLCLAPDAGRVELQGAVTKYLSEHPQELSKEASSVVIDALMAAYPCAPAK